MKHFKLAILVLLNVSLLLACSSNKKAQPDPNLPPKYAITSEPKFLYEGDLWFENDKRDTLQQIKIEIADTDTKREKGLMYRKTMQKDQGMLFIFDEERRQSFWMKNCHLSLDIIFVNAEKQIVHIAENTEPYSLKSIPSFEYAQYVVEVNAGYCKEFAIGTGAYISFSRK